MFIPLIKITNKYLVGFFGGGITLISQILNLTIKTYLKQLEENIKNILVAKITLNIVFSFGEDFCPLADPN